MQKSSIPILILFRSTFKIKKNSLFAWSISHLVRIHLSAVSLAPYSDSLNSYSGSFPPPAHPSSDFTTGPSV